MNTGVEEPIGVLIVDDHALLRDGLRELLETEPDIRVVASASNGAKAVSAAGAYQPDVTVLDVEIPGDDVRTTLSALLRAAPRTRVLILSVRDDPDTVQQLLSMGIRGYLLKSVSRNDFVSAVRGVYEDEQRTVLSISRDSMNRMSGREPELLSAREREIMALVAEAMSNHQIAHRLSITEGTVKRHLRNIFVKLGAVSRIDAVNKLSTPRGGYRH